MEKNAKIYVAGHRGMVGSAIVRELERQGYTNIITRTHKELDLCRQDAVEVCDVASSAYLPHSGKSRLGCEAGTVMKFVFIPFVYCWRAGSD